MVIYKNYHNQSKVQGIYQGGWCKGMVFRKLIKGLLLLYDVYHVAHVTCNLIDITLFTFFHMFTIGLR